MKKRYVAPTVRQHGDIRAITRGGPVDIAYDGVIFHRYSGGGGGGGGSAS